MMPLDKRSGVTKYVQLLTRARWSLINKKIAICPDVARIAKAGVVCTFGSQFVFARAYMRRFRVLGIRKLFEITVCNQGLRRNAAVSWQNHQRIEHCCL